MIQELKREMLVFDPKVWNGKDHPDGNERCWKRATILKVQGPAGKDQIATVRFHHDGRVSRGHYTNVMRNVD